jgi:hypothetical protein
LRKMKALLSTENSAYTSPARFLLGPWITLLRRARLADSD